VTIASVDPGVSPLPSVPLQAGWTAHWDRSILDDGIKHNRFCAQSSLDRRPERRATDHNFRH
jgi:hypothetical protein